MAVLIALSVRQREIVMGLLTILAAGVALMSPPFRATPPASVGVGLFTGVTETATGSGGPPLALLYQHAQGPTLNGPALRLAVLIFSIISGAALILKGQGGP